MLKTSGDHVEENIFDVVSHFNMGLELIKEPADRTHVAELNLIAGNKAKSSTAFEPALRLLSVGLEALPGNIWKDHYKTAFELTSAQAECYYLVSNFEKAEETFDTLLKQAKSKLEKASIYDMKTVLYMGMN